MKKRILSVLICGLLVSLFACSAEIDPLKLRVELNPGIDTVEINSDFDDAGAKAYYGWLGIVVTTDDSAVNLTATGRYPIFYSAQYLEYDLSAVRWVTVVDEIAPLLELNPGIDTVVVGEKWTDAGVTFHDNSLGTVEICVLGTVSPDAVGGYAITYSATDLSGNVTEIVRHVHVVEEFKP